MITAILKFEISNTFSEWEKSFYNHQPIARAAGIFQLYHGHAPENEKKVWKKLIKNIILITSMCKIK